MALEPVQSLWIGDRLSVMERLCINSFLRNGQPYHLYVYGDVKGVPDGTTLRDARTIIPESEIFLYREHRSYAGFSNMFRYKLLLDKGGYWVDTDVVCLRPFAFKEDFVLAREHTRRLVSRAFRRFEYATCWMMKANAGSDVMAFCYDVASKRDRETLTWGETGPRLVHKAAHAFGKQDCILPWEAFFPIRATQWRQFIEPSAMVRRKWEGASRTAFGIHLYNEMWRRNGADKDADYPAESIYEVLKRRYL